MRPGRSAARARSPCGSMTATTSERPASSLLRRLSRGARTGARGSSSGSCSTPPVLWLVVVYLGSLAVMFVSSFWRLDPATSAIVRDPSLANFQDVFSPGQAVPRVAAHTVAIAIARDRSTDALLAFPLAYYMARVATPRHAANPVHRWRRCRSGSATSSRSTRGGRSWPRRASSTGRSAPSGCRGPGPLGDLPIAIVFSYLWLPYMILPLYAGLERIPTSLVEASSDLGGRAWTTFRRIVLPLAFPGLVAGSIFTFSLTLGDYITPDAVLRRPVHRQRGLRPRGRVGQRPVRRRLRDDPGRGGRRLPAPRAPTRRVRGALTERTRSAGSALRIATALTLLFLYVPIAIIAIYAFNDSRNQSWGNLIDSIASNGLGAFSFRWFEAALDNRQVRESFFTSVEAALGATVVALDPRHRRRVRGPSLPVLRPGRDQLRPRPADRAAGHRHGDGAQLRDEHRRRRLRHRAAAHHGPRLRPDDDHRRPRDLLRGRRLQQRDRAAAAGRPVARGGVDGPRRGHVADVPADHVPRPRDGAVRGSAPGVRPVVRRDHRDDLHGGHRTQTMPMWIFANFQLPNARPDRQRRRARDDPPEHDPGVRLAQRSLARRRRERRLQRRGSTRRGASRRCYDRLDGDARSISMRARASLLEERGAAPGRARRADREPRPDDVRLPGRGGEPRLRAAARPRAARPLADGAASGRERAPEARRRERTARARAAATRSRRSGSRRIPWAPTCIDCARKGAR